VQFLHEHCARTAEYEPETVFFFTLAMYCLYRTGLDRRWAPGLGIALGFLALVNGSVVAPALLAAVLYVLAHRPRPSLGLRWPLLGLAAFLAIALPWHVYQFATNGELFRRMYWEAQILGRLTGRPPLDLAPMVPGVEDASRPLYYPHVLLVSMFPWTLFFFAALAFSAHGILQRSRGVRRRSLAALLLPLLWIHAYVAAIFIAKAKFTWYVIPLLPALALVLAWSVQRLWSLDSRLVFYGAGGLLLISSLAMAPSPQYDPCSQISALWPFDEPNLVPLTRLTGSDLPSWLPVGATAALLIGGATIWFVTRARGRRLDGRRLFGLLVLGSFIFSGICQVALPLRGADYRSDFARCHDAVRTRGVAANRALLLDEKTAERIGRYAEYFYVYEMSGGANGAIVGTRLRPDRLADPRVLQPGTLLLGLPRWAPLLDGTDGVEKLWLGDTVVAGYVP
jgi:4-amino-4-deoxy-L-arabinose transferase-like glycosyltransferase